LSAILWVIIENGFAIFNFKRRVFQWLKFTKISLGLFFDKPLQTWIDGLLKSFIEIYFRAKPVAFKMEFLKVKDLRKLVNVNRSKRVNFVPHKGGNALK
jgi:hypothetical protein